MKIGTMLFKTIAVLTLCILKEGYAVPCTEPGLTMCNCIGTQIDCSNLNLNQIPSNIPKSTTVLYLSINDISSIEPGAFSDLQSLKQLFIGSNKINSIDANSLSGLTSLEFLGLDNNEISTIADGAFSDLGSLSRLILNDNRISSINANWLSGLTSVNQLSIGFNKINSIDANSLSGLTSLEYLDLDNNEISSIADGAFSDLGSLSNLVLNDNRISSINANWLSGLTSLNRLYLDKNEISSIADGAFSDLGSLSRLVLNDNRISSINANWFSGLTSLNRLILSDNPLLCCTMADFFEWRQNQNSIMDLSGECTDFNSTTDINSFNVSKCSIDGGWSSWMNSKCSVTCGNGILSRNRTCDSPIPSAGGNDCEGSSEEKVECNLDNCPGRSVTVDGQWGAWSTGTCSVTCGNGIGYRNRRCDSPPSSNNGQDCIGSSTVYVKCNLGVCQGTLTIDGQWGAWSTGTCSVTCGNGIRYRNRRCDSPPSSNNGQDCIGSSTVYVKCNLGVCQAQCKGSGKKQESKRMKTRKWKRYQLRQLNGKSDPYKT